MKIRFPLFLLLSLFVAACSGGADDSGAMAEGDEAPAEMSAEEATVAALEEIRAGYMQHYNLLDASAVADFYADEAVVLLADGSIADGREAIEASLETAMGVNPTLGLNTDDVIVLGDWAVSRGTYQVDAAPEGGDLLSFGGHYITLFANDMGTWKIGAVVSSYDSPRPEGWVYADPPEDGPPEDLVDGPVADAVQGYMTHYNLGHASMVADLHTEDGVTMFADQPLVQGRAGIQAALEEQFAPGQANLTIHDITTEDLGGGYYADFGWYEVEGAMTPDGPVNVAGTYLVIATTADDGSHKMHWVVSNSRPVM